MQELVYDISPSAEDHQAHLPENVFLEVHNKNIGPDNQQWLHAACIYTVWIHSRYKSQGKNRKYLHLVDLYLKQDDTPNARQP